VRKLEQVFELNRTMFNELKQKKKQLPSQCFCKENKNSIFFGGQTVNYSLIFAYRGGGGGSWNPTAAKEKGMSVLFIMLKL
jgi:hypothetical protein